jgi:hypothetical protein
MTLRRRRALDLRSRELLLEERERTREWLARNGQRIADDMFRDACLFHEEERGEKDDTGDSAELPH